MKKFFKLVALILSMALVLGAVACGDPEGKVLVSRVTLNHTSLELVVGQEETLKAAFIPNNATNTKVTWSSSNTNVARIDDNGKVKAVGKGFAIITVTTEDGGRYENCVVSVTTPDAFYPVTGVTLNKTKLTMEVGDQITLKATVKPADANNKNVVWSTNNPVVVNVSAGGEVTALTDGVATIFVKTVDGGWMATCEVKVGTGIQGDQPVSTTYTVAFDSDGGSAINAQTVVKGATATEPADPTKSGFTFAGWQLNGADYDFSTPVIGDITLKATWTDNTVDPDPDAPVDPDPDTPVDPDPDTPVDPDPDTPVDPDPDTPVDPDPDTPVDPDPDTPVDPDPDQPGGGGEGGDVEAPYHINFADLDLNTTGSIKVLRPQNENEDAILDAAIAGFTEYYPNITIEKAPISINDYERTIYLQYVAGSLPEIIWTNSSNYYYLVTNGIALNLDQFMIDSALASDEGLTEFWFGTSEDFNDEFQVMGLYNESRYAVPRSIDSVVTFYNTEIMDAVGVDMTQYEDGWTWADFLEVCQAIREYYDDQGKTNFYCVDPYLGWESVAWPIIKSLGGEIINENGEFALTSEKAAAVHAFINVLINNNYIPGKGESAANSFESADLPLLFQSTTIKNMASKATLDGNFNLLPFPLINGENSAIGTGFAGYAINSKVVNDQNKLNIAGAFMAYLMSYEGQQKIALDGGLSSPSIRADLGTDNPDAEWHKAYSGTYNTSAYTWGSKYKVGMEFLVNSDPELASTIIGYMGTFVGDYVKRYNVDDAYTYILEDIQAENELPIANGLM